MKPVKRPSHVFPLSGKINLSFAGCGFLGIYHVGVASCFKKYAPHVYQEKIAGASAGALVACALIADCSLGDCTTFTLNLALECRKHFLGPFSPNFHLVQDLKKTLEEFLPDDAHERASGKLHVSLTRFPDFENVLVSKFNSREDLIDALICSSYVPFYSGVTPPYFQGKPYFDGAFSNNLPSLDQWTVKISPFSGESDICPDDCSKSFHHVNISGTSAQINCNNAYRASIAFLPPSPEILSEMCQTGFEDALRFLRRNGLISCSQHISIHSALNSSYPFKEAILDERSIHLAREGVLESVKRARVNKEFKAGLSVWKSLACLPGCRDLGQHDDDDDGEHPCMECLKMSEDSKDDKPPFVVLKALNEACIKANKGFRVKLYKYKHLMWLAAPYIIPCSYTYSICKKLFSWAPTAPTTIKMALDNIYNLFVDVLEFDVTSVSPQNKERLVSWVSMFGQYCGLHRCHKRELYSIFFPGHQDLKEGQDGDEDNEVEEITGSIELMSGSSNSCDHHHKKEHSLVLPFCNDEVEMMKVVVDMSDNVVQNSLEQSQSSSLSKMNETSPIDQSTADSYENAIHVANQRDAVLSYCYLEESYNSIKVNTIEIIPLQHV